MANYQDIRTLARSLIGQVTQNGESWKAFPPLILTITPSRTSF